MAIKKRIFVLLVFLLPLFTIHAQTNVYHEFPDSNAVWSEQDNFNPCNCSNSCTDACGFFNNFFMSGDTAVGMHVYHKIYVTSAYYFNGVYNNFPPTTTFSVGIRQDTLAKKVFMFKAGVNDTLLYDFNLHVGDTLPASYVSQRGLNYVSSIDSILIGTNYRKQFHISTSTSSNYVNLIEGIGSLFGLVAKLVPPFESGSVLNCFTQNGNTMYTNGGGADCFLTLGLKNNESNLFADLKVSPNPFSQLTNITTNIKEGVLTICNLYGQQVKQLKIVTNQTIILQRDNLPSGLYFMSLTKNDKIVATKKLIVVD
ncbi:MAG TPA: T9SS type A sorting domain-containing protein [Bacteroidia bacterium]|jgi:hypothetical protein|nr:T9SS type A sorting domain-containing protein [Bacteroidia bacterium]